MSITDYSDSLAGLISVALFGSLVGKALRYSVNFAIARGLGAEALGVFTFGLTIVKAGGMFSSLGLQTAAQKYVAIYSESDRQNAVFGVTLIAIITPVAVGTICSFLLYFSWPALQSQLDPETGRIVRLFVFAIPLYALLITSASSTRGFKQTKYYVYIRDIGQSSVAGIAITIASFITVSLVDVIYAYYLSLVFGCLLGIIYLYHLGGLPLSHSPKFNIKEIFAVSLPLLFISMSQFLISWTDIIILGLFAPSSSVGYYQSAYIWATVTFTIFQGINAILPAMIAEKYEKNNMGELATLYSVMTKWGLYVTLLGTSLVIAFADQLLLLFGPEFVVARNVLIILAIGQTLAASPGPVTFLLSMTEYSKFESVNTIVFGICNLVLNLLLIPRYGIIGAAIATAISMIGLNFIGLAMVWYSLDIQPFRWSYLKGALATLLMAPLLLLLQPFVDSLLTLIAGSSIIGLLYFGALYLLGLNSNDKLLLEIVD
jgi:O-antigen/teichoic acid export membrane protein